LKWLKKLLKKQPETPAVSSVPIPDKTKLTEEEKDILEKALKGAFGEVKVLTMEDLLKGGNEFGGGTVIPFVTTTDYRELSYEMRTHTEACKEWTDRDFVDQLLSYYNEGYDFDGLEGMYNKLNSGGNFTAEEKARVRDWFILVSMEQVLHV